MKKLVCVLGSPRPDGNSAAIAGRLCDLARGRGVEVASFFLNTMAFRGCQGCLACKGPLGHCCLKDDLTDVLARVAAADILVLASPVYYGDVSSQLKGFIDRTYSFIVPELFGKKHMTRLAAGRKLAMVLTQGFRGEKLFDDIYPKYRRFFGYYGFDHACVIRQCGVDPESSSKLRDAAMEKAEKAAKTLLA